MPHLQNPAPLTRRRLLQGAAALAASGGLATCLRPLVVSPSVMVDLPVRATGEPTYLSARQLEVVKSIAEAILPSDDTPGAAEAEVHLFIDVVVDELLMDEDRERFLGGLADLDETCRARFGRDYLFCSSLQQLAVLEELDRIASEDEDRARPLFFTMCKQMTVIGYFTSEVALQHHTRWVPFPDIPGLCPGPAGTRSWATFREG
ncbi:MAG: hypothetical protein ACI8S6_002341 [Myxococcota bacterium]|jgi:hypothetical protein